MTASASAVGNAAREDYTGAKWDAMARCAGQTKEPGSRNAREETPRCGHGNTARRHANSRKGAVAAFAFLISASVGISPVTVAAQTDNFGEALFKGFGAILEGIRQESDNRRSRPDAAPKHNRLTASIQEMLNDLGFDAGVVDGQSGPKTTAAIRAFQSYRGFRQSGVLDNLQFDALRSEHRIRTQAPVSGGLARGQIFETQLYLKHMGFAPGSPDGKWGPRSQKALDAFRSESGLGLDATDGPGLSTYHT